MRVEVGRDVLLISLAGLALRLLFIGQPGHVVDLGTFGQWALAAADNPWDRAYEATNANYPPGALVFFELIGRTYRAFVQADPGGSVLRVALKLPSIAFDLGGGVVAYAIAARLADHRRGLAAAALFDLNPAIVYDSSLWGQNDSITTVTALASIWCMLRGWRVAAWLVLAFAILNKPPVIALAPLFVIDTFRASDPAERMRRLVRTAYGIGAAVVLAYLLAAPFYADRSPVAVFARMLTWYGIGSSLYPYTSANAFNLYALFGDFFVPDTASLVFGSVKYWADAAFLLIAAIVAVRFARTRDARALLEASFLTMLAFFLVLTEMHERYLLYALTFAPPLAALDRRYFWCTIALTLTEWLNLEYSLTYMWINSDKPAGVNPKEFAPVLVRLCALTNIAAFGLGMRAFGGQPKPARTVTGTVPPTP